MIEGYCVKCKAKRPIADAVEEQMKNGRKAVKGKCPTCGAVMFKILGGKASPPVAPAHTPAAARPAAADPGTDSTPAPSDSQPPAAPEATPGQP